MLILSLKMHVVDMIPFFFFFPFFLGVNYGGSGLVVKKLVAIIDVLRMAKKNKKKKLSI